MKANRTLNFFGSTALAALVIHPWATAVHAGVAVSIGQNFTGSTDSLTFSDPGGGVSRDYFVDFNCGTFAVYNRAGGSPVQSLAWTDFWSQAGVMLPGTYGSATPRIIYDPTVQRWFVAEAAGDNNSSPTNYHFLLAVSATADPTGTWNGLYVSAGTAVTNRAAFLNMGLDTQGLYISQVVTPVSGGPPIGCTLFSLRKADLLLIPPVITNSTFFGVLPVSSYGYNIKPAVCFDGGAGGDVLATAGRGIPGDSNSALFAFAVHNAGGPGPATLTSPHSITVPTYLTLPINALQPDGSDNLADGNAAFTSSVQAVGGVLFGTSSVQVGARAGVRWYRVNATNYTLLESGTISHASRDLYYPSIVANTNGTVGIACNGSGTNTFVSCFAAVGQTVNGVTTFGDLLLLEAGVASYQNPDSSGNNNWGRYSTTCLDPTDPNVFWGINTYAAGSTTWATQITQILTTPSPVLSIANTSAGVLLSWAVTEVPFQLQSVPALPAVASWSQVQQSLTTNGNIVSALVSPTNTGAFFRLVQTP
jgi:hypothetical protein